MTAVWGPVATLNLWWVLAFPLSAGGAYLLARRFTASRWIAWFAGLLYGFGPYPVAQGAGHLNLAFVPIPPLVMLCLYDLLVGRTRSLARSACDWRSWWSSSSSSPPRS